eukprot:scaffold106241_cov20-Tisochrysis_lutea.AAC.1
MVGALVMCAGGVVVNVAVCSSSLRDFSFGDGRHALATLSYTGLSRVEALSIVRLLRSELHVKAKSNAPCLPAKRTQAAECLTC